MNFYKTIFTLMIIVLFICLAFIAVSLHNNTNTYNYPPITSECPDYFVKNKNGNCISNLNNYPNNDNMFGSISCDNVNFNDTNNFPNNENGGIGPASAICEKKKWATSCNVNWDGITNNDNICYKKNK